MRLRWLEPARGRRGGRRRHRRPHRVRRRQDRRHADRSRRTRTRSPAIAIEEPTLKLTFGVNTSPFAGREGKFSTSRQLRERLYRELETNLSLRVEPTEQADVFAVSGRGELHLSVLIETMRREGYEFQVSRPEVITREIDGETHEPVEHLVDRHHRGVRRHRHRAGRRPPRADDRHGQRRPRHVRLEFAIPTRGLIGLRNAFLTATKGNGVMASRLIGYEPWKGPIQSQRTGRAGRHRNRHGAGHGLANAQERGITFIEPQTEVYEGMIVGQQPRQGDLPVNVCRAKKLTNMRSSTSDIAIRLTPPVILSLEQALDFLADDELLEVTPKAWRLRKRLLPPTTAPRSASAQPSRLARPIDRLLRRTLIRV